MAAMTCSICGNSISLVQSTREITYNGKNITLHYRCWYENQEVIKVMEERNPHLSLQEAIRIAREGKE